MKARGRPHSNFYDLSHVIIKIFFSENNLVKVLGCFAAVVIENTKITMKVVVTRSSDYQNAQYDYSNSQVAQTATTGFHDLSNFKIP